MNNDLATFKNALAETELYQSRLYVAIILTVLLTFALLARLVFLQLMHQRQYKTLAQKNRLTYVPIHPIRGLIYDRNGALLAENTPIYYLQITPEHQKNLKDTLARLKHYVSITPSEQARFLKTLYQRRPYEPAVLKHALTPQESARFAVNAYQFPGVQLMTDMQRYYPFKDLTTSVTGYVGHSSDMDTDTTDLVGKTGIEYTLENQLHGQSGYKQVETDASGRIVRTLEKHPAIQGNTVYLTIDQHLQKVALEAFGQERGALVAIDPRTGEILALVSHPTYDANVFSTHHDPSALAALQRNQDRPLYNRAIHGQYSPGSIIKPLIALLALEEGLISPTERFYDVGWFKLPHSSHIFHDWKPDGHGWVNVSKAIIYSCDTFFYRLAVPLGIKAIDAMLSQFGFGQKTGILMPNEPDGLLPTPKWKWAHFGQRWYPGNTVISSIGEGYLLATPLQLAQAATYLANRGKIIKPHLIQKIISPSGIITTLNQPTLSLPVRDKKNWDLVIKAMERVITQGTGGIHFGRDAPYQVAAKTSTAEVYRPEKYRYVPDQERPKQYRNISLFIAFAPIKHPTIALASVAENSKIAPLIARKLMDYYFAHTAKPHQTSYAHNTQVP